MGTLDATRPMVGSLALGIARAAHEASSQWVKEELPAGYPAHKRRDIENELEELGQELQMARLLVWRGCVDGGSAPPQLERGLDVQGLCGGPG